MDELDLMQVPPQVQLGDHTLEVRAQPHPDGIHVELRHPDAGRRTYRVMSTGVVADGAAVLDWIGMVSPGVQHRLDAEARLRLRQAGYRT